MKTEWNIAPVWREIRQMIDRIFSADFRSLAALRIVLASTVLFDLADRATNLAVHYSDGGILPRSIQVTKLNVWDVSLNFLNGTAEFQVVLFCITALAAVAMLIGYRTRLMVIIVWVMVMSTQWRNYLVGSSADDLLRLLLFWSMFLPLGAGWSVDRMRGTVPNPPSPRFLSVATAGLFLQIAIMYWFTALLKTGQEWRVDGTAIYYALSARQIGTPLGEVLVQFPDLLKALTFATLGIEIIAPLLLFSPFFTVQARMVAIAAIVSLHAGISLVLAIGFFPWISAACMVCFLPSWFWDTWVPSVRASIRKREGISWPIRRAVAGFDRALWAMPWPRFVTLDGPGHFAAAELSTFTSTSLATARAGTPPRAREILAHRAWHGTTLRRASLATNLFAAACLSFVLAWNLSGVSAVTVPDAARPLGIFLGLPQNWAMFAPYPTRSTMWFIIPGTLEDGRQIDLLRPTIQENPHLYQPVTWQEPSDVRATFNHEERWRKYLESLAVDNNSDLLLYFGQYICRSWNGTNYGTESQLMSFEIVHLWEETLENNQRGPVQQQFLWTHTC